MTRPKNTQMSLPKNLKLSTKLWLWAMGLVVFSMIIFGFVTYARTTEILQEKEVDLLSNSVHIIYQMAEVENQNFIEGVTSLEGAKLNVLKLVNSSEPDHLGELGYYLIMDSKGQMISHPTLSGTDAYSLTDESKEQKAFIREAIEKAKVGGGLTQYQWQYPDRDEIGNKVMYSVYFEPWDWVIASTAFIDFTQNNAMSVVFEMIKGFVIIIVLAFIVIRIFMDHLMYPIHKLLEGMQFAENGIYATIDSEGRSDELGELITGYNRMALSTKGTQETLIEHNSELEEANREIQALYEEMLASEEMLRYNYDELERYRLALEEEKNNYRKILIASNETYWQYDFDKKEISVTNFLKSLQTEIYSMDLFLTRVHPDDVDAILVYFDNHRTLEAEQSIFHLKFRMMIYLNEGIYNWFELLGIREEHALFGSLSDIHQEVVNKERIEFYAFHDPVLGLYNMDFLNDMVHNSVLAEVENSDDYFVLLVIGIVGYDRILNAYGKNLTDITTFQLSAEISAIFHDAKYISVLHSGRFAIWMASERFYESKDEKLKRMEVALKNQVGIFSNFEMPVNLAYGATMVKTGSKDGTSAISEAETAFEVAVSKGDFTEIQWYDDSLKVNKDRVLSIEQHLFKAIERGEFSIVFQPQFESIDQGSIFGFEALLRWKSNELGYVSPNEFIPLAESLDYINVIGRYVIDHTVAFIENQKKNGRHVKVAINSSYKELLQNDYVQYLAEKLVKHHVDVSQVHIEITETTISEYIDIVLENLNKLIELGFQIHMDDFGTGYSSLYQLGRMPIQVLKIDKSFVWALEPDLKMRTLTKLIIDVAHRMDMKIIAEGVETLKQYELLKQMGCDIYQGYLMSKPLSEEEVNLLYQKIE